jgi:predicted nucleotidyltransferase
MKEKHNIKELFFNYSTKHWHFDELVNQSELSRTSTNKWIKRLLKEKIITKFKPKGKMPYYISNYKETNFKMEKRLFAFEKFKSTGFLQHLSSLEASTVIIFGSFARSDWDYESDIDLFIYGESENFQQGKFEKVLKREIQLFEYNTPKKLKKIENIIPNILSGIHVKGKIEPFKVIINA